jgi:hypothetical protein
MAAECHGTEPLQQYPKCPSILSMSAQNRGSDLWIKAHGARDQTVWHATGSAITGGATGIGRAAAKRFIEEGAFVFIFGRRQEAPDAAVAELEPNDRAVKGSVLDSGGEARHRFSSFRSYVFGPPHSSES